MVQSKYLNSKPLTAGSNPVSPAKHKSRGCMLRYFPIFTYLNWNAQVVTFCKLFLFIILFQIFLYIELKIIFCTFLMDYLDFRLFKHQYTKLQFICYDEFNNFTRFHKNLSSQQINLMLWY